MVMTAGDAKHRQTAARRVTEPSARCPDFYPKQQGERQEIDVAKRLRSSEHADKEQERGKRRRESRRDCESWKTAEGRERSRLENGQTRREQAKRPQKSGMYNIGARLGWLALGASERHVQKDRDVATSAVAWRAEDAAEEKVRGEETVRGEWEGGKRDSEERARLLETLARVREEVCGKSGAPYRLGHESWACRWDIRVHGKRSAKRVPELLASATRDQAASWRTSIRMEDRGTDCDRVRKR